MPLNITCITFVYMKSCQNYPLQVQGNFSLLAIFVLVLSKLIFQPVTNQDVIFQGDLS